jgi:hypothetical protein
MKEVMEEAVAGLLRDNDQARSAFDAIRQRGLSRKFAEEEIGRAFLGCLFEVWKGYPDRLAEVLEALRNGRSAAELFPDELYEGSGKGSA